MTKPTGRPRGRPPGARNKTKTGIRGTTEFREKLLGSLSEKQIKALPPELKARLASTLVPRDRTGPEKTIVVNFEVRGIPEVCPHCKKLIQPDATGVQASSPGFTDSPAAPSTESSPDQKFFRPDHSPGLKDKTPAEVEREFLEEARECAEQVELDRINARLKAEDDLLRQTNIDRVQIGLDPIADVEDIFDGVGIKDA